MDKQLADKIITDVESTLKKRIKNGSNKCEIDYLTGAMSVIVAIEKHVFKTEENKQMQNVPPSWWISGLRGTSIFDKGEKSER